jgi:hypothetical protein
MGSRSRLRRVERWQRRRRRVIGVIGHVEFHGWHGGVERRTKLGQRIGSRRLWKRRFGQRRLREWRLGQGRNGKRRLGHGWHRKRWRGGVGRRKCGKRWHAERWHGKRRYRYGRRRRLEHGSSRLRSSKNRVSSCGAGVPGDAGASRRGHLLRRVRPDRGLRLHGGGGMPACGIVYLPPLGDALRAVPLRLVHGADRNDQIASYDGERNPT